MNKKNKTIKELSIEEKAKAYDEALKVAVAAHKDEDKHLKATLERIFPELVESEDEKIRKGIKSVLKHYKESGEIVCPYPFVSIDEALAWFEKQGESDETKAKMFLMNKGYPIDANGTFPTYDEIYNIIRDGIEKQGEKNTAKPKFHEGDWIVHNVANFVFQIVGVGTYGYNVVNREGYAKTISLSNEENYHLWTISDAKDGDVLYSPCCKLLWIYKDDNSCYVGNNLSYNENCVVVNSSICIPSDVCPASKEQRDTLMKAMTDAGWGFDFEKKEMKKIGQKHIEWSAEDERSIRDSIFYLKSAKKYFEKDDDIVWNEKWFSLCIKWLESLHKRLQPQNTWMPSDEQIVALEHFVRSIGESGYASPYDNNTKLLYSLLNNLKHLNDIEDAYHAGAEDILNKLSDRIEKAEIVNVRQVLEWIEEQTKE